eukprot:537568-Pyramimonas_sp.AAC.1
MPWHGAGNNDASAAAGAQFGTGQCCSGGTIRNERKRGNEASAAAGARFGTSGSPKMKRRLRNIIIV